MIVWSPSNISSTSLYNVHMDFVYSIINLNDDILFNVFLPKPTDSHRCLDFLFEQISNEFKQCSTTCSKKICEMIQSSLVLASMFVKSSSFFCLTKSRSLFSTPRQWMMNVITWKRHTKVSVYQGGHYFIKELNLWLANTSNGKHIWFWHQN